MMRWTGSALLLVAAMTAGAAEKTATVKVYGMSCPTCAKGVAGSLQALKGVKSADVSVDKAQAVVVYDDAQVTVEQLKKRIEKSGYTTTAKKPS